jgi:hypothetical protein
MNKRNLFWLHSTKSGLADRLIDFYLMVSYAKLNNAFLNLVWEPQDNYTENQLNVWNEYRFHDYKIENLIQYFKFPENVKFLESMEVSEDAIIFKDYLGGVHSVKSFYEKYCKRNCSLSHFSNIFFNEVSSFKPQSKLINIAEKNLSIDIAVHLRRGDKISDKPDNFQIKLAELESLNAKTYEAILEIHKNNVGSKKINLFIASDDHNVKMLYIENLKDKFNIVGIHNAAGIESTYLDLYYLGISKVIIMSMIHSNFSIFASYLNSNKLIYFYKSNKVLSNSGLSNIVLFKPANIFYKLKVFLRHKVNNLKLLN